MTPAIHQELSHLRTEDLIRDADRRSTHRERTSTRRPDPRVGAEER